ncbi:MAG TPA: enoyl-CoA hydratase/isomerase family protein, partial [Blastocatellia bacterium]|nr:enoyl-CoA hydratase/isomerase family protein [Blastocatellia bacterium]
MLVEFFLSHARFEFSSDELNYTGYVPELPHIHASGATLDACRVNLAEAISKLLAQEAVRYAPPLPAQSSSSSDLDEPRAVAPVSDIQAATEVRSGGEHGSTPDERSFSEILYEKHEWVARVTINRPELYNVYSSSTLREMIRAFRDAASDDKIAVLVLTGAGDQAFCTGSDLKEHSEEHLGQPQKYWEWMGLLIDAHDALRQLGKPSIARINGIVAGGGNEWNLACDLAVAAEHAKFVQLETTMGMVAASGATQWLPLVIGDRRARAMLLACEPVTAKKALEWGLVNEVVPYSDLDFAVDTYCSKLVDMFPDCVRYTRQQLNFWKNYAWDSTIERARTWLAQHFAGPEAAEGMNALGERREIDYRGIRAQVRHNGSNASDH